jgi:putative transposase
MGIIKGKTAIALFGGHTNLKEKPYWGNHFWRRGYCVTIIGMDEDKIRRYVKYQEDREKQEENNSKDYGLFESPDY